MSTTTAGRVLLKFFTPANLHKLVDENVLDKGGLSKLFVELAKASPEVYNRVVSDLTRLGFEVATRQGTSITLQDLVSPIDKDKIYKEFDTFQEHVEAGKDTQNVKNQKVFGKYNDLMNKLDKDLLAEGLKNNRSLAKIILAGSRGSPSQYRSTISTQGIVVDADGSPRMDIPIKSSFAEGLSLPEYLITSFGTRAGEVTKKIGVADGGYSAKQFSRALMNIKVEEHDCGTSKGIPCKVTDQDSVGCFLAQAAGKYNRNNEITSAMLRELAEEGVISILVRSPMTCEASKHSHFGAVCQLCVGKREKGLAALDSHVGLVAGTAMAEPLTNFAMKARHSGGAATSLGGATGFKLINQISNIPKTFLGRAPLAAEDGKVTAIQHSTAGGYFITVGHNEYYAGVGQEPSVKVGDHVEEGQALSTGLVDPSEAVHHRGIGDGRKYYMDIMKKTFDDGKLFVNRRNFELVARAAIDHVQITDPEGLGDYMPDQIVSYSALEKTYEPRKNSKEMRVDRAIGKYLEKPVLHYTIGTKINSGVIHQLNEFKVDSVLVNDAPPNFQPHMVRLLDVPEHTDDFMHVLNSTNLAKRFVNIVNKGGESDLKGPSPVPGLAYGVGFGEP